MALTVPRLEASDQHFEQFYNKNATKMVRFAFLLTGNDQAAEEISQDAFIAVYRRFEELNDPQAYLRTCVLNGSKRHGRREQLAARTRALFRVHAANEDHPDELQDALATLSQRQRVAIYLRYYLDLSENEMAQAMSCRPGTVKSTLHAAHQRLSKELK